VIAVTLAPISYERHLLSVGYITIANPRDAPFPLPSSARNIYRRFGTQNTYHVNFQCDPHKLETWIDEQSAGLFKTGSSHAAYRVTKLGMQRVQFSGPFYSWDQGGAVNFDEQQQFVYYYVNQY